MVKRSFMNVCFPRKKKILKRRINSFRTLVFFVAVVMFVAVFFVPVSFSAPFCPGSLGARALASGQETVLPAATKPSVEKRELAPGVCYTLYRDHKNLIGEPLRVYLLEVDLHKKDVEILPVVAGDCLTGRGETVAAMAGRTGALAAVNGGFYYSDGEKTLPVGNLIISGETWSISDATMASAALSRFPESTGALEFCTGYFSPDMEVFFSGESARVVSMNSSSSTSGVHLFTPRWGERLEAVDNSLLAALRPAGENRYIVSAVESDGVLIPPGGLALRFQGEIWRTKGAQLCQGDQVSVNFTYDQNYWGEIEHLLTSGPLLVEEGEPVFQGIQEGFTGTVLLPNPRTAIGVTADNKVLLVVAERAETGSRVGLTLEETALLMKELGVVRAVGLDGGGSSTFYADGQILNNAGSSPRAVANGLMVLTGLKLYLNEARIFPDVPPYIAEGGRTMVPIRVVMEHLGAEVEWESESRTVSISRGDRVIDLVIDSKEAQVDSVSVSLDAAPVIRQGRTMVPLRFVTENLQGSVHWDDIRRAVYLWTTF